MKKNNEKQSEANLELARRMDKIEQDMKRIKFRRMKNYSLLLGDKSLGDQRGGRNRVGDKENGDGELPEIEIWEELRTGVGEIEELR